MTAAKPEARPTLDEHVEVVLSDPAWPARAEEEGARLRTLLGRRVREIAHIGSTAVPGLAAKPIVDLQLGVAKADAVDALAPMLAVVGYEDLGEAGVPGRRYFRRRQPLFPANLQVVWSRDLWQQNLALRDYLRAHPQEADYYGRQKREILAQGGSTLLVYSDAKAPLLRELLAKAQAWAKRVREAQRVARRRAPESEPARVEAPPHAPALTAAIWLADKTGFEGEELERLRDEVGEELVAVRDPGTVTEVRGYEEHLGTAALVHLLDQYCAEQGELLEPREGRKLQFEVETWPELPPRSPGGRRGFLLIARDRGNRDQGTASRLVFGGMESGKTGSWADKLGPTQIVL